MKTYFLDPIFNHYVDFKGRATRKQFWLFILFTMLIMFIIGVIFGLIGLPGKVVNTVTIILELGLFLPSLAIEARRLRDGGFSPWLLLIGLIPFIGWLVLIVLFCLPSKK